MSSLEQFDDHFLDTEVDLMQLAENSGGGDTQRMESIISQLDPKFGSTAELQRIFRAQIFDSLIRELGTNPTLRNINLTTMEQRVDVSTAISEQDSSVSSSVDEITEAAADKVIQAILSQVAYVAMVEPSSALIEAVQEEEERRSREESLEEHMDDLEIAGPESQWSAEDVRYSRECAIQSYMYGKMYVDQRSQDQETERDQPRLGSLPDSLHTLASAQQQITSETGLTVQVLDAGPQQIRTVVPEPPDWLIGVRPGSVLIFRPTEIPNLWSHRHLHIPSLSLIAHPETEQLSLVNIQFS